LGVQKLICPVVRLREGSIKKKERGLLKVRIRWAGGRNSGPQTEKRDTTTKLHENLLNKGERKPSWG